jgi:RNA polymerase primary sigma factor
MNIDSPKPRHDGRPAPKARTRADRGRGRPDRDTSRRPARRAPRDERSTDIDGVYLAEMAARSVLTPEQEVEIGERIVGAERAVLEAIVSAPTGRRALIALGADLGTGELDVRDVLLNPDQEGLDLEAVCRRVRDALTSLGGDPPGDPTRVMDVLAAARLEPEVVEGVVRGLREAARDGESAGDAEAAARVDHARAELRRQKERLVVGNLRLVVLFARKYLGRGVPLLDLVQEGNLGLMRAADKFDHRRGFRFSTYASWWIKQALQRALLDRALRLPVHVADDRRRIGKIRAAFVAQHRREPNADEVASISGLSRDRVETILTLPSQPASLDAPVGKEGDASLGDFVPSTTPRPDDAVALRMMGRELESMLRGLTEREQQVLRMRFGLGQAREHTLEEVGRQLSLTRERIRQIERHALDKLRTRSERVELESYLDR